MDIKPEQFEDTCLSKFEDEEILPKKRMKPKRRFRALTRLVIANLGWLCRDMEAKRGTMLFNLLKSLKPSYLEMQHKIILNKKAALRTPEEHQAIFKVINRLKCFRKYPENAKMLLAQFAYFRYFGPDRVIVREKHRAKAIYFVMSGDAYVIEEHFDPILQEKERTIMETLTAGDVFGEINLLHDLPRTETIVSATPMEFIILKEKDFNQCLKATVKKEWDYITLLLQSFTYFDNWSQMRLGECCVQSLIKRFNPQETVLGDGKGRISYVHFVIDGSCELIEHMKVVKTVPFGGRGKPSYRRLQAIHNVHMSDVATNKSSTAHVGFRSRAELRSRISMGNEGADLRNSARYSSSADLVPYTRQSVYEEVLHKQAVFMHVCTFTAKACFCVGENMQNRRIVALENLLCLLIPSYLLIGRDDIWLRIKQFLSKSIPTSEEVFEAFLRERQWRDYKQEILAPLTNKYRTNWHSNIPLSLRIRQDFEMEKCFDDQRSRRELKSRL